MVQESFQPPDQGPSQFGEQPPAAGDRAIVSVAFPRADFNRVTRHAAQVNKKTSEFIREAALHAISSQGGGVKFSLTTGSAATVIMSGNVPTSTSAPGSWRYSFPDRATESY